MAVGWIWMDSPSTRRLLSLVLLPESESFVNDYLIPLLGAPVTNNATLDMETVR